MALRTHTRTVRDEPGLQIGDYDTEFANIAAASRVDWGKEDERAWLKANISRSQVKSRQAWRDYERLGEVHKAISRAARIAGYARFRCVQVNPDGTDGKTVETGPPAQIVKRINSPFGGTRGLIDRFFALMKVPGDSYLIRVRNEGDDDFDGYHFLSSSEIRKDTFSDSIEESEIDWITLPGTMSGTGDAMTRKIEGRDMLGRVWLPGRRYIDEPDSPLAALETECEVLWGLTESMKANILNRFALAGILAFPIEIQNVKVPGLAMKPGTNILDYIEMAMTRNVTNLNDAKARLPILLWAKGEAIDQIKKIDIDREIFLTDLKLRAELIDRILFGLDIQTEATKGGENTSHFGVWAQSDEEVRIAVQPDLDLLAWALTRLILHDELKQEGWSDDQIAPLRVAWDMSESAVRTNAQEDTRQAWDRGLASGNAVLRKTGLSVNDDRMPDWEYIRLIGAKTQNVYLALQPEGTKVEDLDWSEDGPVALFAKVKPGPDKETPEEEPSAGPGVGDPGSPDDNERKRTGRQKTPE